MNTDNDKWLVIKIHSSNGRANIRSFSRFDTVIPITKIEYSVKY